MDHDFESCLDVVLLHEGAEYTNDPDDSGGPTKYGISLVEDALALKKLLGREPTAQDVENLTEAQAGVLFKEHYWTPLWCSQIADFKVCLALFDMGVLIGIGGAVRRMQYSAYTTVDSAMGPKSIAAINAANPAKLCGDFLNSCEQRFRDCIVRDPKNKKFWPGWINRVNDLRTRLGV